MEQNNDRSEKTKPPETSNSKVFESFSLWSPTDVCGYFSLWATTIKHLSCVSAAVSPKWDTTSFSHFLSYDSIPDIRLQLPSTFYNFISLPLSVCVCVCWLQIVSLSLWCCTHTARCWQILPQRLCSCDQWHCDSQWHGLVWTWPCGDSYFAQKRDRTRQVAALFLRLSEDSVCDWGWGIF